MFLSFDSHKNIKVYQMDGKYAFLNGVMEEKVYIEQPKGFTLAKDKEFLCKLKNALYGLK